MSHFTVGVFTKTGTEAEVEKLLLPYCEDTEFCPKEYLTFDDSEEAEQRETWENDSSTLYRTPDGSLVGRLDERFRVKGTFGAEVNGDGESSTHKVPDDCVKVEVPYKIIYPSFDDFMESNGYEKGPETGKYGYWTNPNAKWDWYRTGGRWTGMLLLKDGASGSKGNISPLDVKFGAKVAEENGFDAARVSDIDFDAMAERSKKNLEPFESCWERKYYKPEYFAKKYPDEEIYIRMNTTFSTYAVVTPDGEWKAPGEMGWWGLDNGDQGDRRKFIDTYYERFIKSAIENGWYLTIVDCHI